MNNMKIGNKKIETKGKEVSSIIVESLLGSCLKISNVLEIEKALEKELNNKTSKSM